MTTSSIEIQNELKKYISGEIRFDDYSRQMYSTDGSIYKIDPMGVVIPQNYEDVIALHEFAFKNNITLTPRGGGTSLSGQTVNDGIVVDFSKYLNKIIKVSSEEKFVITQPGISIDNLNRELKSYGLFFTPDPSTKARANIGGAIGNNSCGSHSIIYGKTVDQILGLKTVLSNGEKINFSEISTKYLENKLSLDSFEGKIYREILDISSKSSQQVKLRFPKILRRVGGYNLDLIEKGKNVNLSKIIVGSEGTLVSILEAKLNLVKIPKYKILSVFHFNNISNAMEATVEILTESPSAVEHIGEMIIQQARQSIGFAKNIDFLKGNPTDIIVVEMSGNNHEEVLSKTKKLERKIIKLDLCEDITTLEKPQDQSKVWNMREAGLGLMMNIPGDAKPLPFVEDTAVSPEKLPEYVKRFDEIVRSNGTEAGYYGHASVGCLHVRPVINIKNKEGIKRMHSIADEISDLVLEFGGAYTGEHGDGIVRGAWAEKMFGKKLVNYFSDVKKTFDPNSIMNPGKIFNTPPMTSNLRYGTKYKTKTFETKLDWSKETNFTSAIEKCNGVGACRKMYSGAMCPSYQATQEEEHSTRGRANALRSAISGALPYKELSSKRMFDVLDLCLECKSCKSECPSNVDMAKIKYEFLNNYYLTHKIPIRSRMIANVHMINSLTSKFFPRITNFLIRSLPARIILHYLIGLDKRRKTPKVVSKTFENWFKKRNPTTTGSRGEIVLFHDTFMNFNHPESGIAATKLLEALGFKVIIVDRKCCGRPIISKGMLDQAKKFAEYNVDLLYNFAKKGIKIVGCESSCIIAIKDDYPDLLVNNKKAKVVAKNTFLIQDLLNETSGDDKEQINWNKKIEDINLHVHCHERALSGTNSALEALNLPSGYNAKLIDAGCCGMAGSFGFEKEHYDVSIKIGEERLFPAIRKASKSSIPTITGISCKQQIEDGTGVNAKYLTEILADALQNENEK